MTSTCGFCRARGHSLRQCNSPQIEYAYFDINNELLNYLEHFDYNNPVCREFNLEMRLLDMHNINALRVIMYTKFPNIPTSKLNKEQLLIIILDQMISNNIVVPAPPQQNRTYNNIESMNSNIDWNMLREDRIRRRQITDAMNALAMLTTPKPSIKFKINVILEEDFPEPDTTFECSICMNTMKDSKSVTLNCNHLFCGECIDKSIKHCKKDKLTCALCRNEISVFDTKNSAVYDNLVKYCM